MRYFSDTIFGRKHGAWHVVEAELFERMIAHIAANDKESTFGVGVDDKRVLTEKLGIFLDILFQQLVFLVLDMRGLPGRPCSWS